MGRGRLSVQPAGREVAAAFGLDRIVYEDTDHYQVTRNFLNRREAMLDILLAPD